MNKNKKLIIVIISVVSSVLAGIIIFSTIFFHFKKKRDLKKQNDLQQEIATLKKEKDQLLAQVSQIDWQTYKGDFYDEPKQKKFQQKKIKLQKKVQDLNVDCNQTDLEDQKECWLGFNHEISQTISNFQHFNNSYYQSYQTFNNTFNDTKNQFNDLLTNIGTLNITTFNHTQYDLDFLSPEGQTAFQDHKAKIITDVQQLNNSNVTDQVKKNCSQNTLYQQLKCFQQQNQLINKTLNEFSNFGHDYQKSYQIFNDVFHTTKEEFAFLLNNTAAEFDSDEQALKNLNLSAAVITKFNADAKQVLSLIKQFDTVKEVKCFQNKNLYQQAKCYRENVANLNTGYDKIKAQKQFLELKNQFLTLDVTELKTTKFDVSFLSSEQPNEFLTLDWKEKFIKFIAEFQTVLQNLKQIDDPQLSLSSTLKTYQEQNQLIVENLVFCQDLKKKYFDSFKSSLLKLISEIQPEIAITQAKQTELLSVMKSQKTKQEQDVVDQTTTTIQEITQKIKDFEQKVTEYEEQPWSAFKAYHDFLTQYQTILTKSKDDIMNAKDNVIYAIARIPVPKIHHNYSGAHQATYAAKF